MNEKATIRWKNIAGQHFGKLTALDPTENRYDGSVVWHCKCDCGNDAFVPLKLLTRGSVKSCGCLWSPPLKEYIGRKFGLLTVLSYVGKHKGNHIWHCRCDCGNETDVRQSNLQNGSVKSCGCLKWKDISGQRFGRLTALERADCPKQAYRWKCICDCGTIIHRTAKSLQRASERGEEAACPKCSKRIRGYVSNTYIPKIINSPLQKNNTSGYTGVYYDKQDGMWRAVINFQKKRTDLGRFQRIDDAIKARKDAEDRLFNRFLKELNEQTH